MDKILIAEAARLNALAIIYPYYLTVFVSILRLVVQTLDS